MIAVGITGNIATGKSQVTKYLLDQGYIVVDSDTLSREALTKDVDCIQQVQEIFPTVVKQGIVDRKKLGNIIFNNRVAKEKLEAIVHPYVIREITRYKALYQQEDILFLDIPLLYEAHLESLCDIIVVVYCDVHQQLHRLMIRDDIDEEYARKKMASQWDIQWKKQNADYVVDNSRERNHLHKEIERVLKLLHERVNE